MIDRVAVANEFGWTVQEVYRAKDSWRKLYARQPSSTITFEQYLLLMWGSDLRPSQVGLRNGQFNLARYGDSGAYHVGSCRFIRREQNIQERKEGYQKDPNFRARMSELAKQRPKTACAVCGGEYSPGMWARWHANCEKGKT